MAGILHKIRTQITQDTHADYTRYARGLHKIRAQITQDTHGDYTRYARGLYKIRAQIIQDTRADLPPIKYLNPRRGFGGFPR